MYPVSIICNLVNGRFLQQAGDTAIVHLVYDSRRIQQPSASLFFALTSDHNDGHRFLQDAWKKGVRNFIVSKQPDGLTDSNVIIVHDALEALQLLAIHHRKRFQVPVIGITGSNGKTIVKEWLNQMLQPEYETVRSPKSFNSQIGVPLSVWQMNEHHTLAIFEAGISRPGEMEKLAAIIQPTIGVLTNIGEAHNEGFKTRKQKEHEKAILFRSSEIVISPGDDLEVIRQMHLNVSSDLSAKPFLHFSWGFKEHNHFHISTIEKRGSGTIIKATVASSPFELEVPFTDDASIENCITCCCVMLAMGYKQQLINERLGLLHSIDMRLQLKHSFNDCVVINDSYSADITSLRIALDFLKQQSSGLDRTVIISEFIESGRSTNDLYVEIAQLLRLYDISKIIVIGEQIAGIMREQVDRSVQLLSFSSTEDFISGFRSSSYYREIILVKGARKFEFERIASLFEEKKHQTVLEINLNSLAHNLKQYQGILKPGTKVMAMVKAFSYGSGGAEIASVLQFHNVDYLGVAYADEGAELVRSGISLPIMVMNAEESSFRSIVDHNLQPVIYSYTILDSFQNYIREQGLTTYPVHIELDTGMNRLGFPAEEASQLAGRLSGINELYVVSVFSHLAASESPEHDAFTQVQADIFGKAVKDLREKLPYHFIQHISNSAAIARHPQLQMDMVRLGIGLYGIEIDEADMLDLQAVATLRSTIAQLRKVAKGETVSYSRKGVAERDSLIATVRIGYADGYSRRFGNGTGKMMVKGQLVPVIGVVCMDMTMIDVTDVKGIKEGDEVIIFGPRLPVQEVASWIETIPYELMTSVSQRVKRVYFHE